MKNLFLPYLMNWTTDYSELPGSGRIIGNFVQMPVSDNPPPVPESMRHHYKEGELDKDGYVIAHKRDK